MSHSQAAKSSKAALSQQQHSSTAFQNALSFLGGGGANDKQQQIPLKTYFLNKYEQLKEVGCTFYRFC